MNLTETQTKAVYRNVFIAMEVGGSFEVNSKTLTAVSRYNRLYPDKPWAVRKIGENRLRCWRVR